MQEAAHKVENLNQRKVLIGEGRKKLKESLKKFDKFVKVNQSSPKMFRLKVKCLTNLYLLNMVPPHNLCYALQIKCLKILIDVNRELLKKYYLYYGNITKHIIV